METPEPRIDHRKPKPIKMWAKANSLLYMTFLSQWRPNEPLVSLFSLHSLAFSECHVVENTVYSLFRLSASTQHICLGFHQVFLQLSNSYFGAALTNNSMSDCACVCVCSRAYTYIKLVHWGAKILLLPSSGIGERICYNTHVQGRFLCGCVFKSSA